ncbi:trypsin-like serine protease [Corynebacterium renale]|uniref:trypsin-like serine protease n=1 Tax=Corynebacterium renale TaxID=1724 RepID=UPI0015F17F6E|nr:trypsin-like serine protease [Corynebacterium renale]
MVNPARLTSAARRARTALAAVMAFVLLLVSFVAPAPAGAQARPVMNQGSVVETSLGSCTVGAVDQQRRIAVIAAHCGNRAGEPVVLYSGGKYYPQAGTFHPSPQWDPATFSNDWAIVKLSYWVQVGQNPFSGEEYMDLDQVRTGDRICFHGRTTHPDGVSYSCSTVAAIAGSSIFYHGGEALHEGDSGGPTWIERGGQRYFVGVTSGWYWQVQSPNNKLARATYPRDRPRVSLEQIDAIYRQAFPNPEPAGEGSSQGGIIATIIILLLSFLGVGVPHILR